MKISRTLPVVLLAFGLVFSNVAPMQAASEEGAEQMKVTMGTLMGQSLVMTYLTIGAVADGFTKKVYSDKEATEVLDTCENTIKIAKAALVKLMGTDALDESDRKYVSGSIDAYDGLAETAGDVKTCMGNMSKPNINKYMSKKDETWKKIQALLQ